jgi:hypothetical protein
VKRAAVAAFAFGLALAQPAGAVERENHVGIDAGGAMLVMSDKTDVGGGVGAHWAYGLSDAFNLMLEAAWSPVALGEKAGGASAPRTRPSSLTDVGVGLGYVLDVLQWVPYGGVLLGGYALTGGTLDGAKILPGVAIGVGLDYRLGRSWAVGVAARQHMLFTEMATYPSFTQLFARFEYTWGW